MIRALYRVILWLHPPAFRRAYADEMLWLFDCTVSDSSPAALLIDGVVSLLRQWFLRSRLWLVPVALAGALFTVLAANALLHFVFRRIFSVTADKPQELFLLTVALALITVAFVVFAAVQSVMRVRRRA
jgi:hypothetical protein